MCPARSTIRFAKMSKRYEQEQGENAKKIKALRLELKKDEGKRMDIDEFLDTVRRYTDATTITKRMVAELIDHIEVYHAEKQDGVTNQRVVIHYNCIGAFDVPDRRKIPEADIVFLDEIFKCNDGVLNALLTALNERKYTNEGRTYPIPTISFFAASNEIPNFNEQEEKIIAAL